tara:strand:- start:111108 stop:112694 length:1587 start_codon:yes stop_codon:yes gene_type:complete
MSKIEHINLIGDPCENFFALGAKDKDAYQEIYSLITRLCARNDVLAKAIKTTSELAVNINNRGTINLNKEIEAYAEGLKRPTKDVYFALLLPEIVASFNKWTPNLMSIIPGCSSLFTYNDKLKATQHTRILDYALVGPFEKYERTINIDFKKRLKIFGLSTVGLPFPSLSSMNESGLTLALHYKNGDFLDLNGDSIFNITYQILSYCTSVHDVKKFLKNYPTMAHWGIYLSDKMGNVTSLDVKGNEIYQEKFEMKEHNFLYFNNRPLLKNNETDKLQPYGNLNQCSLRRESINRKLKNKNFKVLDTKSSLIATTTIEKRDKWFFDVITPSSIQAISMDAINKTCHIIPGKAPKYYRGELIEYKNIFDKLEINTISEKVDIDQDLISGQERLANFQSHLDGGKIEQAYHEIQMSYEYLKKTEHAYVVKFYILVLQYIYESNKKDLAYLYTDFKELEGKLPTYLNDHRLLFMMRLEKLLGHPILTNSKEIKNENLKNLYDKERKLKKPALIILKKLIFPRVEILDILYGY